MQVNAKYPALLRAIMEMQMDNGYVDEAGAVRALERCWASEQSGNMGAAEEWCAALPPEALSAACTGEEQGTTPSGTTCYNDITGRYVVVPPRVHALLNWLFDEM
jgi:hypothetical protein